MARGARRLGTGVGCSRRDVYGAAGWVCYLLGSRTAVQDKGGRAVEEALGTSVQGVEDSVWGRCRQVPEEDFRSDG